MSNSTEWRKEPASRGPQIDPPVGPYHSSSEIQQWLDRLRKMPPSRERDREIERAEGWLESAGLKGRARYWSAEPDL